MDALTALRSAILAKQEVQQDGDNLVINGVKYPVRGPTAFKAAGGKLLDLISIWMHWQHKDLSFADYMKLCREKRVNFVLVTDRDVLTKYLMGQVEADDRIDRKMLSSGAGAGAAATSSSALEDLQTVEGAIRREIAYKTRINVLECNGKNLRDEVFRHFQQVNATTAAPAAPAAAPAAATLAGHKRPASAVSGSSAADDARKRARPADPLAGFRGTPIIVVPAHATSLINMYNAAQFLEKGQFVPPDVAKAAAGSNDKPAKITIKRIDSRGNSCQYYIVDSVASLQRHDWLKIVAVFAAGPDWQFKGWKWGKEAAVDPRTGAQTEPDDYPPVKIFSKALGFHLHYEADAPHPNCQNWAVTPLPISSTKRYLDPGVVNKFWAMVDRDIQVKKAYLLPKGAAASGGAGGAGAQ